MLEIAHLLGKLLLDDSWRLIDVKDGIEVWQHAAHGWINHIIRATGEMVEV